MHRGLITYGIVFFLTACGQPQSSRNLYEDNEQDLRDLFDQQLSSSAVQTGRGVLQSQENICPAIFVAVNNPAATACVRWNFTLKKSSPYTNTFLSMLRPILLELGDAINQNESGITGNVVTQNQFKADYDGLLLNATPNSNVVVSGTAVDCQSGNITQTFSTNITMATGNRGNIPLSNDSFAVRFMVSPYPQHCKEGNPPTDQAYACQQSGGNWMNVNNGCVNKCNYNPMLQCAQPYGLACVCGQGHCWNGSTCVTTN